MKEKENCWRSRQGWEELRARSLGVLLPSRFGGALSASSLAALARRNKHHSTRSDLPAGELLILFVGLRICAKKLPVRVDRRASHANEQ